jgi:hypothetical protein
MHLLRSLLMAWLVFGTVSSLLTLLATLLQLVRERSKRLAVPGTGGT